jgi:4-amino-4-deoxy-L-arabinose transferase-like glycosyltransferase
MSKHIYHWSKLTWILALTFLLLGGMTRFYRLDWSFWGDETATFIQVESLFGKPFFTTHLYSDVSGTRSNPLGYSLQYLVYKFFGTGEREARLGVATAGTLAIALIFLLTSRLYGHTTAVILAGIVLLSPWHLFHSQNQRNYSYVFLFGSIALLTAALAWKENSRKWAVLSGLTTALAVLTHSLSIIIPVGLGAFVIVEGVRVKGRVAWQAITGYLLSGVPLLILISVWAWLGWRHWSGGQQWGYTSLHVLMGLIFNMNWGLTLIVCIGWLWAFWYSPQSPDKLWVIVAVVVLSFAVIAPNFLSFRHDYVFSSTLVFFMLAARFMTLLYENLKKQSNVLAIILILALLLLPFPSYLSHYQDGNRHDYRAAAQFITDHYQPSDIVASATWTAVLRHYLPFEVTPVSLFQQSAKVIANLENLISEKNRVWLVSTLAREEYPPEIDRWLWQHAVRMLRIKKKRFDYHENITEVYLIEKNECGAR